MSRCSVVHTHTHTHRGIHSHIHTLIVKLATPAGVYNFMHICLLKLSSPTSALYTIPYKKCSAVIVCNATLYTALTVHVFIYEFV